MIASVAACRAAVVEELKVMTSLSPPGRYPKLKHTNLASRGLTNSPILEWHKWSSSTLAACAGVKVLVKFARGRSDGDVLHVEADHPSGIPTLGDRQLGKVQRVMPVSYGAVHHRVSRLDEFLP
eukprot:CAMPEP_0198215460 /NCGR_PEP_ID=MMETSP1445-20131203/50043_1 /TAXON_ID=36898 /ORGANISM="Pyramimonas sp., Strain CCMP2087" /LENGTH=123 /DNA_ID=CAMNT_0043891193 /DNA_START=192 /DNA_END=562 /DNA_ORIENTATION=+